MAYVVKRKRKGRDGKVRTSARWQGCYRDGDGREHRKMLYRDKQLSLQKAIELEQRARAGEDPSDPFKPWRRLPIGEHVAAFAGPLGHLEARGTTERYRKEIHSILVRGCEAMGVTLIADLTTTTLERYLARMVRPTEKGGLGLSFKTHNATLRAFEQFAAWLVEDGRWGSNPTKTSTGGRALKLRRLQAEPGYKARQRRALTAGELQRLLASARVRDREELVERKVTATAAELAAADLAGEERAVLYLAAGLGGLRRGELKALMWANVKLDHEPPVLVIWAEQAKARREDVVPMAPDLADALREWRGSGWPRLHWKLPGERDRVFSCVTNGVVPRLHADLRHAQIPVQTPEGIVQLHSLRHTLASLLVRTGTASKVAMGITRHRSDQAFARYTHVVSSDHLAAVERLPRLGDGEQAETSDGTRGRQR